MNKIINRILSTGIKDDNHDYLNDKIKVSNIICLLMIILVLFFGVLQVFRSGSPAFHFITAGILASIIGINKAGAYTVSRTLTILVPLVLLNFMKYKNLITSGAITEAHTFLTMGLLLLGFILFDPYEKTKLYVITIGIGLISVLLPIYIIQQALPEDRHMDLPNIIANFTAVFFIYISLMVLISGILRSRKKSNVLLSQLNTNNAALKKSQEELNQRLIELDQSQKIEKQNSWISRGLNELGQLIRENEEAEDLYDLILSKLVNYIGVNQGSLFVLENEERELLVLTGCYAYDRKKFVSKKIEVGQGLVGQCYLEKEPVLISEVPEGYISITSGLGKATPKFICLMPMIAQEKVEGIIELASFEKLEQYKIDFLEKFGEIMASQIRNIRNARTTRQLLDSANHQRKELTTQQEELRQNLEEMEAIQETLERRNVEAHKLEEENEGLKKKVSRYEQKLKGLDVGL